MEDIYFQYLGGLLRRFVDANGAEDRLLGIGLALPGVVDEERGILRDSRDLELRNVPLSRFTQQFPWPCRCLSSAHAAGLAEFCAMKTQEDMVSLSLGHGGRRDPPGRRPSPGRSSPGGRVRTHDAGPGRPPVPLRKDGCLDAYCSAKVLADHAGGSLSAFFRGASIRRRRETGDLAEYRWSIWPVAVNNLRLSFDCGVVIGGAVGA